MSQNLINRVLDNLKKRRNNILEGNINSIPSPFQRFKEHLVGVEQGTYYIVTGYSGGAKSQFSYFFFVFEPLLYLYENRDKYPNLKYTVFCMPLEETAERITQRFISYLLFKLSNGRVLISPKNLRSSDNSKPLPKEILDIIESEEYRDILYFFEKSVNFVLDVLPHQFCDRVQDYCEKNGKTYYKKSEIINDFGEKEIIKEFDYYIPNNPQEYIVALVDHISLLPPNGDLKSTIISFSNKMVKLRNDYNITPVIIQQQAAANETIEAFKVDRSRPTQGNLGDCKSTGRDSNVIISIYNPYAHNLKTFGGYDLTDLKGNARFIEILKNRDGTSNMFIGLLFNGACAYFKELSLSNDFVNLMNDINEAKNYAERSKKLQYIQDKEIILTLLWQT